MKNEKKTVAQNFGNRKRFFLQTTRELTAAELAVGYSSQFDSDAKKIHGIMIINTDASNTVIYQASTISFDIQGDYILKKGTPPSLLQCSVAVEPNERFFTLFQPREIDSDKFTITLKQDLTSYDFFIVFLLEYKDDVLIRLGGVE